MQDAAPVGVPTVRTGDKDTPGITFSAKLQQKTARASRAGHTRQSLNHNYKFSLVLDFDHGLLVVGAALSAYSVGHSQSATLTALDKSRSSHFPVCSSLIPMTSGRFILRADRHCYTSLPLYSHTKDIIRMPPPFVNTKNQESGSNFRGSAGCLRSPGSVRVLSGTFRTGRRRITWSAHMSRGRSRAPHSSRWSIPVRHCRLWRS